MSTTSLFLSYEAIQALLVGAEHWQLDALSNFLLVISCVLAVGWIGVHFHKVVISRVMLCHGLPQFSLQIREGFFKLLRNQQATATIEFTLVFPILLFLIMLLTQSTLLMGARLVVNHAAFVAARSAVVTIPLNEADHLEPYNTVQATGSYKAEQIRRSAVMALLPVAGRLASSNDSVLNPDQLVNGLTQYYRAYDLDPPFWIERYIPDRLRYADVNTQVAILRTRVIGESLELQRITEAYTFGPRDPITIEVTHRMNLAVPYVGFIFANGRNDSAHGGGLYTNITSRCTLTNEGIIPELPPKPDLNRIP